MKAPAPSLSLPAALALHREGRFAEAADAYARIRAAQPKNFDAAHLAGTLALQQGRLAEAAETLAAARRLDPRSAVCAMRLGVALHALGRPAAAETELRAALALDPRLPEGWFHLSRALEQLGRMNDAIAAGKSAVAAKPDYAEAHDQLGALVAAHRGQVEAEPHFRRATELEPGFARAWCNLGVALVYRGRLTEAIAAFDRALALDPQLHHAYAGRGLARERSYLIAEAAADYARAIAGDPGNLQARSARLLTLHYLGGVPRAKLLKEHQMFGEAAKGRGQVEKVAVDAGQMPPRRPQLFQPDPFLLPLRVGFLSPNLRTHAVAYFLEPLLAHLDSRQFETFLYHDHPVSDATSERLRKIATHWRHVAGLPPAALEARVRSDRLDVLLDLAGHTELNRLASLARRLAPVQATYLGYPDTTGLCAMDYRLVDGITDPAGEAEAFCTEELVRFAPTAWCYAPPPEAPERPPADPGRPVTFGCFNNFAKVTDDALRAWGELLATVPGSRLVLKSFGLGAPALAAMARGRLAAAGIDPARVELLDRIDSVAGHLAAYGRMDISLDTFPYHGTTTTCESLWMGVPVVTLAGDRHSSRVGISLLRAVDHAEWIARDWTDYVRIAATLAGDRGLLAAWRTKLREEMQRSALLDHAGQAQRFGAALQEMSRRRTAAGAPRERAAV